MALTLKFLQIVLSLLPLILIFPKRSGISTMHLVKILLIVFLLEIDTIDPIVPEPYIKKMPFLGKVKKHSIVARVVNKSAKKPIEPDEQITVEPTVAIVKDLVSESVEDGHIIFCEDASNIVAHPRCRIPGYGGIPARLLRPIPIRARGA